MFVFHHLVAVLNVCVRSASVSTLSSLVPSYSVTRYPHAVLTRLPLISLKWRVIGPCVP